MVGAMTRMALQIRLRRGLNLDDYFLLFACICLTAGTILGYVNVDSLYFSEDLGLNPGELVELLEAKVDIASRINAYERLYYTYPALLWAAIFAVKFAYLTFFRQLVDRVKPLVIYWRVIVGVTIVAFPICIISIYVACVKWGLEAGMYKSTNINRSLNRSTQPRVLSQSISSARSPSLYLT